MILAIDFDMVIHQKDKPIKGRRMGGPTVGAVDSMQFLHKHNHELIVHTVMATNPSGQKAVEDWLNYYGVPYDEVTAIKPNADYFIDDKAIKHTDWQTTLGAIK